MDPKVVDATFADIPLGPTRRRRSRGLLALLVIAGVGLAGVVGCNNHWFDLPFAKKIDASPHAADDWVDLAPVPPDTARKPATVAPDFSSAGTPVSPTPPKPLKTAELDVSGLEPLERPKTFEETHKAVKQAPGTVFAKKKPNDGSTLTIRTEAGTNYYVQLNAANSKNAMQGIYVIGGKPVTVEVPIGGYEIVYATGDKWYGRKDKFGPDSPLFKTDATFDFRPDADGSIPYYEIELIQQVGGNMATHRIDPSQFGE